MTVKCFKPGGTAFVLGDVRTRPHMSDPVAAEVVKVGRKYVTVMLNGWELRFCEPCNDETYFVEDKECGVHRLLFPTKAAADRYCEREELRAWVAEETGWLKMKCYTLEQLRQVKQILERVRPENGPLTLFELECMIGERVWVEGPGARENGRYAVVEGVNHEGQVLIVESGFPYYNYGELGTCQAYREKPEDAQ